MYDLGIAVYIWVLRISAVVLLSLLAWWIVGEEIIQTWKRFHLWLLVRRERRRLRKEQEEFIVEFIHKEGI